MKELAVSDGSHGGVSAAKQAEMLRKEQRSGRIQKGRSYRLNQVNQQFELLSARDEKLGDARRKLAQIETQFGSNWQTDLMKCRLRLLEIGV